MGKLLDFHLIYFSQSYLYKNGLARKSHFFRKKYLGELTHKAWAQNNET